jgi:hypothetical protein
MATFSDNINANLSDSKTDNSRYVNIEKHMKDAIRQSNHVDHVMIGDILDDLTSFKILELISKPKPFKLTDRGLVFKNDDGDDEECVNYGINITADGKWLSSKIDPVSFDIEQDGNLRKAGEAQAAYCLCIIYCVLSDEILKTEIESLVDNYDFVKMVSIDNKLNFIQLLERYQDLQSTSINISVSAAKYNISNIKKDSEKFLKENIPEDRINGLRELNTAISSINRNYSLGVLAPDRVRLLNKLEVLSELDKRNREIENLLDGGLNNEGVYFDAHSEATLWRILNLSYEFVSPIVKR